MAADLVSQAYVLTAAKGESIWALAALRAGAPRRADGGYLLEKSQCPDAAACWEMTGLLAGLCAARAEWNPKFRKQVLEGGELAGMLADLESRAERGETGACLHAARLLRIPAKEPCTLTTLLAVAYHLGQLTGVGGFHLPELEPLSRANDQSPYASPLTVLDSYRPFEPYLEKLGGLVAALQLDLRTYLPPDATVSASAWRLAAAQPPARQKRIRGSGKKLLILDVDGLLVHRIFQPAPEVLARISVDPDIVAGEVAIFLRPYAREFVQWCSERFVVAVWSTAMGQNVEPLVDLVFLGGARPAAIFDQSDCADTGVAHPDKPEKLKAKLLSAVWGHPAIAAAGPFDEKSTLLLDDAPWKTMFNKNHTAAFPVPWEPGASDELSGKALGTDGDFRELLGDFAAAADGREAVKAWQAAPRPGWRQMGDDPLVGKLWRCSPPRTSAAAEAFTPPLP
jgi:hypothetical protein